MIALVIILFGVAGVIALVVALKRASDGDPFWKVDPPTSYTKVGNEWEAETHSSARYRSEQGIVWYEFPDGHRAQYGQNSALEKGLERHKRLEKWSQEQ
jgi:hypothetical protein